MRALAAAAAMLGLGYAAVPLYDLFCRVTGFGGTTQVATAAEAVSAAELARSAGAPTISIRFDAPIDVGRVTRSTVYLHRVGDSSVAGRIRTAVPPRFCAWSRAETAECR